MTAPDPYAVDDLREVARIMRRYRLDSVEMPSGLKVLKTTHAPEGDSPSPQAVSEAVERRMVALGIVNAAGESGRVPLGDDEIMFAASRAPALDPDEFAPHAPVAEEPDDE